MPRRLHVILLSAFASSIPIIAVATGLNSGQGQVDVSPSAANNRGHLSTGTELIAVFVTASTCVHSREEGLPDAISDARNRLEAIAERQGKQFAIIGVALDLQPETGYRFLEKFGNFDEVVTGRGWLSTGSTAFLLRGMRGPLATPQLLVIERDITVSPNAVRIGTDRLVARYLGRAQIANADFDARFRISTSSN